MSRTPAVLISSFLVIFTPAPLTAQDRSPEEVAARTVKHLDADKDGVVSRAEFLDKHDQPELWQKLDKNGDGVLDADEQKEAFTPKYKAMP